MINRKFLSVFLALVIILQLIIPMNINAKKTEAELQVVKPYQLVVQQIEDSKIKIITFVSGDYSPIDISYILNKLNIDIGNEIQVISRPNSSVSLITDVNRVVRLNLNKEGASEYPVLVKGTTGDIVGFRFSKEFINENNFTIDESLNNFNIGEENKWLFNLNYITYYDLLRGPITIFGKDYDKSNFKIEGKQGWGNVMKNEDLFSISKISQEDRVKFMGYSDKKGKSIKSEDKKNQVKVDENITKATSDLGSRVVTDKSKIPTIENDYLDWIPKKLSNQDMQNNPELFKDYISKSKTSSDINDLTRKITEEKKELVSKKDFSTIYFIPEAAFEDDVKNLAVSKHYNIKDINKITENQLSLMTNRVLLDLSNKVTNNDLFTLIVSELSDRLNQIAEESMKLSNKDITDFDKYKNQDTNTVDWGNSIKEEINEHEDVNSSDNNTGNLWSFWDDTNDNEDTTENIFETEDTKTTDNTDDGTDHAKRKLTKREKEGYKLGTVKQSNTVDDILDVDASRLTKHGYSDASILMDSVFDIHNQRISPYNIPIPQVMALAVPPLVLNNTRANVNILPYIIYLLLAFAVMILGALMFKKVLQRSMSKENLKQSIKFKTSFDEFEQFEDKKLDI